MKSWLLAGLFACLTITAAAAQDLAAYPAYVPDTTVTGTLTIWGNDGMANLEMCIRDRGYITSHGVHELFNSNDINNVPYQGQDASGNYYWPDTTKGPGLSLIHI